VRGKRYIPLIFVLAAIVWAASPARAQDEGISLGELARSVRKAKQAPDKTVIDNDNFTQVMDDAEKNRKSASLTFSFDSTGRDFQVSTPDVTCSLSFSAKASALLTDPALSRELPSAELAKLAGPASIHGDSLEVSISNGTGWNVREITVGLTILRHSDDATAAMAAPAKLMPASGTTMIELNPEPVEKHSDVTVLYHLKGSAAPYGTTVFRGTMAAELAPDEDWHWAIVQAKGVPPVPVPQLPELPTTSAPPTTPETPANTGPVAGPPLPALAVPR